MKVTVYPSPTDAKEGVFRKAAVVLADVLRFSSAIPVYLSHGAKSVLAFPDPASAKAAFSKLKRGEGLLAGEAHWEKVAGFPLSVSPLDSSREKMKNKIVCLSSRSAQALRHLKGAEVLLLGSFVNLSDVYDTLLRLKRDVVVVCGVSDQGTSPEDMVFAGMIADFLQNTVGSEPVVLAESARKAIGFYKPWQGRLHELLLDSPEGREIAQKGHEKDLNYCSRMNRVEGVPILRAGAFVRESAPRPKLKPNAASKAEAAAPSKGKAIKVHVPLFPKNPEHPTPELDPKKKAGLPANASKSSVPSKGTVLKSPAGKTISKAPSGKIPPTTKGALPQGKASAKGAIIKTAGEKAVVKSAHKAGGKVAVPASGKQVPPGKPATDRSIGKPPVRKTPLFSKRTVAVPVATPKPVESNEAVIHAMDALKASLAHLKDRKTSQVEGKRGAVPVKAAHRSAPIKTVVPPKKPSGKRK